MSLRNECIYRDRPRRGGRGLNTGYRRGSRLRWPCRPLVLACLAWLAGCEQPPPPPLEIAGATMGTTYSIKLAPADDAMDEQALQRKLESRLAEINRVMSTWNPESELMRLNRNPSTDCIELSADLATVIDAALEVSELADGSFDVTVGPLVNLWGFGPDKLPTRIPSAGQIGEAMARVGYRKITLDGRCLRKARPDLFIDLSAIAKGYAVDEVAELLLRAGIENFMVEIGGEVRARGRRDGEQPWRIGIEKPVSEQRAVQKIVPLSNLALATSGDYRNYFEQDGVRYSHIIDAVSGRPIRHNLVSVTVAHESCMLADAFATAFMVLGPERALRLAEREQLAVMAIVKQDGQLREIASRKFEKVLN